jgi:hypothetical protein
LKLPSILGKLLEGVKKEKKHKKDALALEHLFKGTINREATWALKRAGVLPLPHEKMRQLVN